MSGQAYSGTRQDTSATSDYNALNYLISEVVNRMGTVTIVQVTRVTNVGELVPVGYLDARPMIHQIDGKGNTTPHDELSNMPYFRLQGGGDAIILDPKVGDIGIALICSRDNSTVKNSKKPGPPGSRRRYDMSDGLYIGGILNGVPTQYVRFSGDGIEIWSPTAIVLHAPNVRLDAAGNLITKGEITRGGTVLGGAKSVTLGQHSHTQDNDSHGDTEVPTDPPIAGT